MPGPRPTPIQLRLLRGNPGKRSIRGFLEPPDPPEPPQPPDFLQGYALEEWRRIMPSLMVLRLVSSLDVMLLAGYCIAYARWRTAEELLQELAEIDERAHGLLVKGSTGQAKVNPLIEVSRLAAHDMIRIAAEFGFSPAARSRISGGIGGLTLPAGNKFAGLSGGLDKDKPPDDEPA